jgi:hypothetical protein
MSQFYGDVGCLPPAEVVRLYEQTPLVNTTPPDGDAELRKLWQAAGPRGE